MIPPPVCWPEAVAVAVSQRRWPRRTACGGASQVVWMIPPPADRSGMISTPLRSPLRARRMVGIYDHEESIRRASAGSRRAWYTMKRAGGHQQVVG